VLPSPESNALNETRYSNTAERFSSTLSISRGAKRRRLHAVVGRRDDGQQFH
jgi:hypothetical protein